MRVENGRQETELERWDRNFTELLQELRVAQAGVQFLFAFLLTLAFTNRFGQVTAGQKTIYLVALLAAVAASGLLTAPVGYHRMLFRLGVKPRVVRTASVLAVLGLAALVVAMTCAVLLVVDVVLGGSLAVVITAGVGTFLTTLWFVLPVLQRIRFDRD